MVELQISLNKRCICKQSNINTSVIECQTKSLHAIQGQIRVCDRIGPGRQHSYHPIKLASDGFNLVLVVVGVTFVTRNGFRARAAAVQRSRKFIFCWSSLRKLNKMSHCERGPGSEAGDSDNRARPRARARHWHSSCLSSASCDAAIAGATCLRLVNRRRSGGSARRAPGRAGGRRPRPDDSEA